jgi:hypothetical protein
MHDFKDLSGKKLVHALFNEQTKMFGDQKPHLNRTGDTRPFLSSLACLIIRA